MAKARFKKTKLFTGPSIRAVPTFGKAVTGFNTGKVYPYASTKRGGQPKPAAYELVPTPRKTVAVTK